jgi:hypothetical protein
MPMRIRQGHTTTFAQIAARAALKAAFAMLCATAIMVGLSLSFNLPVDAPSQTGNIIGTPAKGSPAALIASRCAPVPVGAVAGHAVVTLPSHRTVYASSGAALDQVFGGVDNGLTVHSFCK